MDVVKKLYLQAYFFVMALYVFFNKGIAYSFLAEALWAGGFLVLFLIIFGSIKRADAMLVIQPTGTTYRGFSGVATSAFSTKSSAASLFMGFVMSSR
jgi:energy-coupling factor transporter transmembrane protein EcfT